MRKAYPTPVVLTVDGQPQSLSTAAERLYALDPETGKELWFVDYPGFSNVPLPVTDGRMALVCTGFMKPEIWGIRLGGAKGNATASHVAWKQSRARRINPRLSSSARASTWSAVRPSSRVSMSRMAGFVGRSGSAETSRPRLSQRTGAFISSTPSGKPRCSHRATPSRSSPKYARRWLHGLARRCGKCTDRPH